MPAISTAALAWDGVPDISNAPNRWGIKPSPATTGLTYAYKGGAAVNASTGVTTLIADGTVALTDNTVNYVERTYAGVVTANTTAFTKTSIPMAKITTASGVITVFEDWSPMHGAYPYFPTSAQETAATIVPSDVRYPYGHIKRYGAVCDATSTTGTDDAAAWQRALNSGYKILTPFAASRINTCLNGTNRGGGGLDIEGEAMGVGGVGTVIYGSTSGLMIDATGSQFVRLQNISLISHATNPSTAGILHARSTTSQFAQFCELRNFSVNIASNAAANSGRGSYGVYTRAAELLKGYNVDIVADQPLICTANGVTYPLASPFVTIDGSITSDSVIQIGGASSFVTFSSNTGFTVGGITYKNSPVYLENTIGVEIFGYLAAGAGSAAEYAIVQEGCTNTWIRGHVEGVSRTLMQVGVGAGFKFDGTQHITAAVASSIYFAAANSGLTDSDLNIRPYVGSLVVPLVAVFDATSILKYNRIRLFGGQSLGFTGSQSENFNEIMTDTGRWVSGPIAIGAINTITYSASMTPDATLGNNMVISATNGTAFTINKPTNAPIIGMTINLMIRNTSGGALGAATFGTGWKQVSYAAPTNGNSTAATFRYDGTNYVQQTPWTTNVPN